MATRVSNPVGEMEAWPTISPPFTIAPFSYPYPVPLMNFMSIEALSLLTMTKSMNCMAEHSTHSAPFSLFQVVNVWNLAGDGTVPEQLKN